jgi:hypothetical protein
VLEPRSSDRGSGLSAYLPQSTVTEIVLRVRRFIASVVLAAAVTSCGRDAVGRYALPAEVASEYATGYIAVVVADPPVLTLSGAPASTSW